MLDDSDYVAFWGYYPADSVSDIVHNTVGGKSHQPDFNPSYDSYWQSAPMTSSSTFLSTAAANTVFNRTGEGFLGFVGSNSKQNLEPSHTRDFNIGEPEAHANMPYWQLPMPTFYDPTSFGFEDVFYPTEMASAGATPISPELTAAGEPAWHEREPTISNQHPTSTSAAGSTASCRESVVVDFEEPSGPLSEDKSAESESEDELTTLAKILCPLGCGERLKLQRGIDLRKHLGNVHELFNSPTVLCPVAHCTIQPGPVSPIKQTGYTVHFYEHLAKIGGYTVYCPRCKEDVPRSRLGEHKRKDTHRGILDLPRQRRRRYDALAGALYARREIAGCPV